MSARTLRARNPKSLSAGVQSPLKEELQNRFTLISEERVKNVEQNSENLMKIG